MVAVIVPLFTFGTIGGLATGSRMIWSFSRDRGMPLWRHLSKVDKRSTIPLYAIGLATIAAMLLSLITLGSTTALNDVVSLSVGALFTSYLISASLLLWRRTTSAILERPEDTSCHYESRTVPGIDGNAAASTPILTWGPWKLPNLLGIINNVVACCFLAIILFFSFWPPTTPTSGPTMNFSSLMLGSMILFATFYYVIWARKIYHGPVIEVSAIG
jgi:choline transport protein